jgi:adenine-specific DNA-methyltransferase
VNELESLTVKKLPQAVLHKCEWARADYSRQTENLPAAPKEPAGERAQTALFATTSDDA